MSIHRFVGNPRECCSATVILRHLGTHIALWAPQNVGRPNKTKDANWTYLANFHTFFEFRSIPIVMDGFSDDRVKDGGWIIWLRAQIGKWNLDKKNNHILTINLHKPHRVSSAPYRC